jgi:hypothetical protein
MAGFAYTIYAFWKVINAKVVGFFFVSLAFFLGFILREMFLAQFYEGFMEHSSIKSNTKNQQDEIESEIQATR